MNNKVTPTLALIVAGGLAAGVGLARPAPTATAAAEPIPEAGTIDESGDGASSEGGYRQGNRVGSRGGTAAGAPETGATPDADTPPATGPTGSQPAAITIEGFAFSGPAAVAPGTPLAVTNRDAAAHTLTFRSGEVDTGNLAGGASTSVDSPTAPGTYEFFCAIHPSMEGRIVIEG